MLTESELHDHLTSLAEQAGENPDRVAHVARRYRRHRRTVSLATGGTAAGILMLCTWAVVTLSAGHDAEPSVLGTTPPVARGSASPSQPAATQAPACRDDQIKIGPRLLPAPDARAGGFVIEWTNVSRATCAKIGTPDVIAAGSAGQAAVSKSPFLPAPGAPGAMQPGQATFLWIQAPQVCAHPKPAPQVYESVELSWPDPGNAAGGGGIVAGQALRDRCGLYVTNFYRPQTR